MRIFSCWARIWSFWQLGFFSSRLESSSKRSQISFEFKIFRSSLKRTLSQHFRPIPVKTVKMQYEVFRGPLKQKIPFLPPPPRLVVRSLINTFFAASLSKSTFGAVLNPYLYMYKFASMSYFQQTFQVYSPPTLTDRKKT